MAKQRFINTRFWDDSYIVNLDPIEKLLYLYLLTNPLTEISGAYEIPLRRIAFDTGIDKDMVIKILDRFKAAGKVDYRDGWILITNFIKHQSESPKIVTAIENSLKPCPDWIKQSLGYGIDTLSHLKELNNNLNTTHTPEPAHDVDNFEYPIKDLIDAFPQVIFQPTQLGYIEAAVKDTPTDRAAWAETITLYRQNYDPITNSYLPSRIGTVLEVFRKKKATLEKPDKSYSRKTLSPDPGKPKQIKCYTCFDKGQTEELEGDIEAGTSQLVWRPCPDCAAAAIAA